MSKWRFGDICGGLSLLCLLPFLTLIFPGGWGSYPVWVLPMLLRGLFLSPFAGALLALVAATRRKWWLALAAAWLAALAYGWWDLSHHPFYI